MKLSDILCAFARGRGQPLFDKMVKMAYDLERRADHGLDDDVRDFQKKFGYCAPDKFATLSFEETHNRIRLIREEFDELMDALVRSDAQETVDGCVDLIYVAIGTLVAMGIPFNPAWKTVHESNMLKDTTLDTDGDPMKSEGWQKPDFEGLP